MLTVSVIDRGYASQYWVWIVSVIERGYASQYWVWRVSVIERGYASQYWVWIVSVIDRGYAKEGMLASIGSGYVCRFSILKLLSTIYKVFRCDIYKVRKVVHGNRSDNHSNSSDTRPSILLLELASN